MAPMLPHRGSSRKAGEGVEAPGISEELKLATLKRSGCNPLRRFAPPPPERAQRALGEDLSYFPGRSVITSSASRSTASRLKRRGM